MKMIKCFQLSAALFLCFSGSLIYAQPEGINKIIVIDPGHGGKDPGAIGVNGMEEADVVLRLAKKILYFNNLSGKREIFLTRYTDTLISLKDRAALAKMLKADLFISLHCNHAVSPIAKGVEIFVAPGDITVFRQQAILQAYRIHKALSSSTGIPARGIKFQSFQVLKETIDHFPSFLIELCFLSNREEANYLSQPENLERTALLILATL